MGELKKLRIILALTLVWAAVNSVGDIILPYMMEKLVDNGVVIGDRDYVLKMAAAMACVALVSAAVRYMKNFFTITAAQRYGHNMRKGVFDKIMSMSPNELDEAGPSGMITRATGDITQVQSTLDRALRVMIRFPVNCIGGAVIMLLLDTRTALIVIAVIPLLGVIAVSAIKSTFSVFEKAQSRLDDFNRAIREKLRGVRVIKAFDRFGYEEAKTDGINGELASLSAAGERKMALLNPTASLIMNVAVAAVVVYGVGRVLGGTMKLGVLMACVQYGGSVLSNVLTTTVFFSGIPRAVACAGRIQEVMDIEPAVKSAGDAPDRSISEIEFRNVTYGFKGAEEPVLEDVSFRIKRGEVTAIVGSTGAGKTTIIDLMERFADVTSGAVLADGTDIREIPVDYLRGRIALSPQKTYIFGESLRDALRSSSGDSDERMLHALETAQATDFTDGLWPDGELSQGGSNLSGGQRQRVSIARALAKDADFYVFDDSFSALDRKTDADLRAALRGHVGDAGILIVSQRISSVRHADRIIVLDGGRVVGEGTHPELISSCGVYREFANSQAETEAAI